MMSSERLKNIKERSKARRQLLAQQLGARDDKEIGTLLGGQSCGPKVGSFYGSQKTEADSGAVGTDLTSQDLPSLPAKVPKILIADGKEVKRGDNDSDEEIFEEVYRDSSTFLKGTQSLNPHNDYCQHFVDTKQRPQNFIRDTGLADRFEEYPKLKELIRLKDELITKRATPPMYLCCDLETYDLRELNCKFDVIHIDPPLEEYQRRCPGLTFNWKPWDWDEIMKLEIGEVAAQRSFVFLWCGAAEGLDEGRRCLKAWGFRRCEDICWIKTNKAEPGNTRYMEPRSILQHTKEHCLMGIKGTVRRSTDGDFIHANVDLDIIITEEPEFGSLEKPTEIFHIMEHFCLGRRRLHLFGNDNTLRPGWLTVGPDLSSSNFSSEAYNGYFANGPDDHLLGSSAEIETLRPKSPPVKAKNPNNPNRGRGGGRGAPSLGRGGPPVSGANMPSMGRGMHGNFVGPPLRGGGFSVRGGHFQRGGFPPR